MEVNEKSSSLRFALHYSYETKSLHLILKSLRNLSKLFGDVSPTIRLLIQFGGSTRQKSGKPTLPNAKRQFNTSLRNYYVCIDEIVYDSQLDIGMFMNDRVELWQKNNIQLLEQLHKESETMGRRLSLCLKRTNRNSFKKYFEKNNDSLNNIVNIIRNGHGYYGHHIILHDIPIYALYDMEIIIHMELNENKFASTLSYDLFNYFGYYFLQADTISHILNSEVQIDRDLHRLSIMMCPYSSMGELKFSVSFSNHLIFDDFELSKLKRCKNIKGEMKLLFEALIVKEQSLYPSNLSKLLLENDKLDIEDRRISSIQTMNKTNNSINFNENFQFDIFNDVMQTSTYSLKSEMMEMKSFTSSMYVNGQNNFLNNSCRLPNKHNNQMLNMKNDNERTFYFIIYQINETNGESILYGYSTLNATMIINRNEKQFNHQIQCQYSLDIQQYCNET
ncbi:hypothetical protein SNEBB_002895 [Seison nebaliae]|nr:hypothetical protein SNEBB_002895 [Seison nebaliae]